MALVQPLNLDDLPPELVKQITAATECKASINSLAKCSRRLHELCTPELYSDVDLHFGDQEQHVTSFLLASTLTKRPEYAAHVRHLSVLKDALDYGEASLLRVHNLMNSVMNSQLRDVQDKWNWLATITYCLKERSLISLLLPFFVNICSINLILSESDNNMDDTIKQMQRGYAPFGAVPSFDKLADVMISPSAEEAEFTLNKMTSWLLFTITAQDHGVQDCHQRPHV